MRNCPIALAVVLAIVCAISSTTHAQTRASSGTAQAQAGSMPDLSGDWNSTGPGSSGCGWNPADPQCSKLEDGTPYQPWALDKLKSERPGYGPNKTFDNTTDPHMLYCDPMAGPRVYFNPSKFKFVQTPEAVYILYEYGPYWVNVRMNGKHPDDPDPTWWGDSIGRYEGDTLVVDTVGFNDKTWLDQLGRPHTEKLHVIQRYRKIDAEHLELDVTFDDPGAYTKPWTGKKVFTKSHTGFARYMWVCTYLANHEFDNDMTKKTVGQTPAEPSK